MLIVSKIKFFRQLRYSSISQTEDSLFVMSVDKNGHTENSLDIVADPPGSSRFEQRSGSRCLTGQAGFSTLKKYQETKKMGIASAATFYLLRCRAGFLKLMGGRIIRNVKGGDIAQSLSLFHL